IVQRQPFGGMKASCFGFGMKAGGSNYVIQFMNIKEAVQKENYQYWNDNHFSKQIDYVKLRGQHNINVYLKRKSILLLVDENTPKHDISLIIKIAKVLSVKIEAYALKEIQHSSLKINVIDSFDELEPKLNHSVTVRALNYDTIDNDF